MKSGRRFKWSGWELWLPKTRSTDFGVRNDPTRPVPSVLTYRPKGAYVCAIRGGGAISPRNDPCVHSEADAVEPVARAGDSALGNPDIETHPVCDGCMAHGKIANAQTARIATIDPPPGCGILRASPKLFFDPFILASR